MRRGCVGSARLLAEGQPVAAPAIRLEIALYALEVARGRFVKTTAYNQQIPGPLLRLTAGRPLTSRSSTAPPCPRSSTGMD